MKYKMTATGTIEAATDAEVIEFAQEAEALADAPDDGRVEIREIGNSQYPDGRLVYVTPEK